MANTANSTTPTYQEIVASWNAQADEYNQWDDLGEDEKIEWAVKYAVMQSGLCKEDPDSEDYVCLYCSGSGEGMHEGTSCGICQGSGVQPK